MEKIKRHIEYVLDQASNVFHFVWQGELGTSRRVRLALGVGAAVFLVLYLFLISAPASFPRGKLIEVPEGASLSEIAHILKEERVVRSSSMLQMSVYLFGYEREVQFGDYLFERRKNVFSIARAIGIGVHGLDPVRVRVPEGATVTDIATLFDESLERFDEMRFVRRAQAMEGYLYPDTYFFLPNANDDLVLRTLRQSFDAHIASIQEKMEVSGRSLQDTIIMASILEREAHDPDDRRLISGVLWKRFDEGMLLQVDAVFLYTLGKATFDLTSEDLKSDDPYNTYVYKGLPPTPIGSPSLDAILAAIEPTPSEYYFYLADRNYITHYSETYEEHLEKKRLYLGG